MSSRNFSPEERPIINQIEDEEKAYIFQRYKEIHDFLHVILDLGSTEPDEILVKWFELIQFKFPVAALSVMFYRMNQKQQKYVDERKKWIVRMANQSQFMMNVYFEKNWDKDILQFKKQLGIIPQEEFHQ